MSIISLPAIVYAHHVKRPNFNVYYPIVRGLSNAFIQQHINRSLIYNTNELIARQGYPQNPLADVTAHFEVKTNQRDILSISLINYTFSGGAHGLTVIKSATWNTQTGKLYALRDLFQPGAPYVKTLSDLVEQQIRERDLPLLDEFKGIRPDQDYYIADKALVIYFQLYELTPYVYGFPYFPISVYDIQDILDENGPLGKMLY
jgi:hypothetical protein